jgi:hypothetical protein
VAKKQIIRKRQTNGCYCDERHSTPRDIVAAFAACKHPKSQQMRIDANGEVVNRFGLLICCHCGAHRRHFDGAWVYPHLAACAYTAGKRQK